MGKWTDKLYITHSEWSGEVGQHSASAGSAGKRSSDGFKRLPFYCCSLSLQPFEHPVCTPEGIVFDLVNIVPYLKKYGTNPVTGKKLDAKDLIKLNFFKNENGDYHCPVTFKAFSEHTAIAAVKTSGNVFAYDTIERLNAKAKYWKDLVTDEAFTRKDIIMIQDPHNMENRDLSTFHYKKNDLKVVDAEAEKERNNPLSKINLTGTTGRVLAEMTGKTDKVAATSSDDKDLPASPSTTVAKQTPKTPAASVRTKAATPFNAAHYSQGYAAASLTSTAVGPVTVNESALIDEEEFMYKHIKTKAYASLQTNLGNLNIELFSDKTPRTCHNFIQLAKTGYYKDVPFHRSIKNFMIQGGDPTGTGRGGESIWKAKFPDELRGSLSHNERGILSMANSGKDTNGSQFFITYRPCTHLDMKHTIFGKVVGGLDVLNKMEAIPADEDDRPEKPIKIKDILVFVDPYEEYHNKLEKRLKRQASGEYEQEKKEKARLQREKDDAMGWFGPNKKKNGIAKPTTSIGKYIGDASKKRDTLDDGDDGLPQFSEKKKVKNNSNYGNFDNF
ncbi:peptidyl-prolyl cis-trans isomerase-like 2 [Umbelopsis sp. AD052]|nr:peptidyl-prolyl cis-trans isomerase-like 2 [Umbelopsis sp. AD052]